MAAPDLKDSILKTLDTAQGAVVSSELAQGLGVEHQDVVGMISEAERFVAISSVLLTHVLTGAIRSLQTLDPEVCPRPHLHTS